MDHAHGHFVVVPESTALQEVRLEMERALVESGWTNPLSQMIYRSGDISDIGEISQNNPYLLLSFSPVGSTHFDSYLYKQMEEQQYVESQLLRRIISHVCFGQSSPTEWHWRDIVSGFTTEEKIQNLKKSVLEFRAKFK